MDSFSSFLECWPIKIFLSALITVFSPFEVPVWVLVSLIIINSLVSAYHDMKIKSLNIHRLKKFNSKILFYFLSILVVRLLEIGVQPIVDTTSITYAMVAYLILTVAFETLEILILLGAPVPPKLKDFLMKDFENTVVSGLFKMKDSKIKAIDEIEDFSHEFLLTLPEDHLREFYEIIIYGWSKFINVINSESLTSSNNDLLYYKVIATIKSTESTIIDEWKVRDVPIDLINSFKKRYKDDADNFKNSIRPLCYSNESLEYKKNKITEDVQIFLYKLIAESPSQK